MPRRRALRGPRCPRCGRQFGKDADVVNHMNQPWSKCANWMTDLERISETIQSVQLDQEGNDASGYVTDPSADYDDISTEDIPLDNITIDNIPPDNNSKASESCYVDIFPGAGDTYGSGKTFMDNFHSDHYAADRLNNIYYPFRNRSEWELASWLLRSGLSMRAIDDFLALELVSFQINRKHNIRLTDNIYRFTAPDCLLAVPRSYEIGQRCSPKALNGNANRGHWTNRPNNQSNSFIATALSA